MSTKRVLIVDDSELMRKVLTDFISGDPKLEVCGEAADGMEAVKVADELKPDLILLDMEMPEWDGMGFCVISDTNTKVKSLSSGRVGGAFKPIGMAAERSGADAVVSKPTGKAGDGITDSLGEELKSKIYELLEIASHDVMPAASLDQPHAS